MTLLGATTPNQSETGSNGNEGVLCIPQSSRISRASPLDFLMSYSGLSLEVGLTPQQRCSLCILQPQLKIWETINKCKQKDISDDKGKGHWSALDRFKNTETCR